MYITNARAVTISILGPSLSAIKKKAVLERINATAAKNSTEVIDGFECMMIPISYRKISPIKNKKEPDGSFLLIHIYLLFFEHH